MVALYKARAVEMEYHIHCMYHWTKCQEQIPAYNLREQIPKNYKELEKPTDRTALYRVEFLEREYEQVGYSHKKDAWIGCMAEWKYSAKKH